MSGVATSLPFQHRHLLAPHQRLLASCLRKQKHISYPRLHCIRVMTLSISNDFLRLIKAAVAAAAVAVALAAKQRWKGSHSGIVKASIEKQVITTLVHTYLLGRIPPNTRAHAHARAHARARTCANTPAHRHIHVQ